VYCWGRLFDSKDQVNFRTNGSTRSIDLSGVLVDGRGIKDIKAGEGFTCVTTEKANDADKVHCWGDAFDGVFDGRARLEPAAMITSSAFATYEANGRDFSDLTMSVSTSGKRVIHDVVVDSTGMMVLAGAFEGDITLCGMTKSSPAVGTSAFVVKLNPKVSPGSDPCVWSHFFAGDTSIPGEANLVTALALDDADNIYLTGKVSGLLHFPGATGSTCGDQEGVSNVPSMFVARYDANGDCKWTKVLGTAGSISWGFDIAYFPTFRQTTARVYAVGIYSGQIEDTTGTTDVTFAAEMGARKNAWLLGFDLELGEHVDGMNFPKDLTLMGTGTSTTDSASFRSVVVDAPRGRLIVAGRFSGKRTLTFDQDGQPNIARYRDAGATNTDQLLTLSLNVQDGVKKGPNWLALDICADCEPNGLTTDGEGNVYVAGSLNGAYTFLNHWPESSTVSAVPSTVAGTATLDIFFHSRDVDTGDFRWAPQIFARYNPPPIGMLAPGSRQAWGLEYEPQSRRIVMVGDYDRDLNFVSNSYDRVLDLRLIGNSPTVSSSDFFVAIFDEAGHLVNDVLGGLITNYMDVDRPHRSLRGIGLDGQGHVYVAGEYNHGIDLGQRVPSLGSFPPVAETAQDAFVLKLEPGFRGSQTPVEVALGSYFRDEVPPIPKTLELRIGNDHICALSGAFVGSSPVRCWGNNEHGQVDPSTPPSSMVYRPRGLSPHMSMSLTVDAITQLSAGRNHNCVLTEEMSVRGLYCWGQNDRGQCGPDNPMPRADGDVAVNVMISQGNESHILPSASSDHTCFLTEPADGVSMMTGGITLDCWGDNACGQSLPILSAMTTTDRNQFVFPVSEVNPQPSMNPSDFGTGDGFSCFLDRNTNQVWCWGRNDRTQLGREVAMGRDCDSRQIAPVESEVMGGSRPALSGVTSLAAGQNHACAVVKPSQMVPEEVWCWGDNSFGQRLGAGAPGATQIVLPDLGDP
jgi:hypothetical protein